MARSIQKSQIALGVLVLALVASLSHAEDAAAAAPVVPPLDGGAAAVLPDTKNAPPLTQGGAAPPPTPNALPARTPIADPLATLPHATGEAVTTETRHPDGSVITVTRFNGQIPHHVLQPHFAGMWSPFQYGLQRPYYP